MSRRYPRYAASGATWVGTIPAHWSVDPLGSVLVESKVKNSGMIESNLLSLSYGRIVRKNLDSIEGLLPASFETYQIVEPDQIVFRFTDLQNDQRSLRSARVTERGIITSAYIAARPVDVDGRYASFLMRSYDTSKVFYGLGGGVRQSLKFREVSRLPFLRPPLDEQRAIANYLDRETARIETIIAEQQRLIEMLQQRRNSVVDLALGHYGFKIPSKFEDYGGSLPDGWRLILLGRTLQQLTNGFVGPTRDILVDEGIRYIQSTHIKSGRIEFDRRPFYVSREWHDERPRIHLRQGDVLIVQTGDIGKVAVVPPDFGESSCHALQIARVRPKLLSGEYLGAFLSSRLGYQSLLARATGAMHPHLEAGIRSTPIVVPPLEIQAEIVVEVESQTAKIDALIAETEKFIELARERRSALITAAVTGQIDVRGAA